MPYPLAINFRGISFLINKSAMVRSDIESFGVLTPCRHFGVVLPQDQWSSLAKRLEAVGADFYTKPQTVFPGLVKEQQIMLVHDGCGNIVEFKANPPHGLFAKTKEEVAS